MAMVPRQRAGALVGAAAGGMALDSIAKMLAPLYRQYAADQGFARRRGPSRTRRSGRRRRQLGPPPATQGVDPYDNVGFTVTRNVRSPPMKTKSSILWPIVNPAAGGGGVEQRMTLSFNGQTSSTGNMGTLAAYATGSGAAAGLVTSVYKFVSLYRLFRIRRLDVHFQTALGSTSVGTIGYGIDRNPEAGAATSVAGIANLDVHSILPVRGSGGVFNWRPLSTDNEWKLVSGGTNISTGDSSYGTLTVYHVNGSSAGALVGHLVIDLEIEFAEPIA